MLHVAVNWFCQIRNRKISPLQTSEAPLAPHPSPWTKLGIGSRVNTDDLIVAIYWRTLLKAVGQKHVKSYLIFSASTNHADQNSNPSDLTRDSLNKSYNPRLRGRPRVVGIADCGVAVLHGSQVPGPMKACLYSITSCSRPPEIESCQATIWYDKLDIPDPHIVLQANTQSSV